MAADFEVTVGADLTAYNAGLQRGVREAAAASSQITRSLGAAAAASTAMGGAVMRGSNQAGNALMNLSRVAQDAPFGFIGIQNNLNPLLESFQRLRVEAGSNMGALRALGSSLIGAGGLGIALSVVSSAITFYTMWQQRAGRATKETTKDIEDQTSATAGEVAKLDTLYTATQNLNLPMSQRIAAVNELQKEYPAYFKNMSDEAILAGKAASAYDNLTQSIIKSAIVKAGEAEIADALKPLIKLITEQEKLQQRIDKMNADAQKRDPSKQTRSKTSTPGFDAVKNTGARNIGSIPTFIKDAENNALTSIEDYKKNLEKSITEARASVQKLIQDFGINSLIDPNKTKEATDKSKTFIQGLEEQLKSLQDQEARWIAKGNTMDWFNLTKRERNINALIALIDKLKAAQDVPQANVQVAGGKAPTIDTGLKLGGDSAKVLKGMQAYQQAAQAQMNLKTQTDNANEAIERQEHNVTTLSAAFGTGLMGAFQSVLSGTQGFISAMGQFLGQLISRLIAAAAAAAILAVILGAVGFGAGLGGAASSFGSFKNLFGSFSGVKLAEGGITTGPTRALIGEGREKEAVMPLSKLQAFVNNNGNGINSGMVVGVLRGPDQLLQIRRAEQQKQRIG